MEELRSSIPGQIDKSSILETTRSIISIQKRIHEHQLKLEQAKKEGKLELAADYETGLEDFYEYMRNKKRIAES